MGYTVKVAELYRNTGYEVTKELVSNIIGLLEKEGYKITFVDENTVDITKEVGE